MVVVRPCLTGQAGLWVQIVIFLQFHALDICSPFAGGVRDGSQLEHHFIHISLAAV